MIKSKLLYSAIFSHLLISFTIQAQTYLPVYFRSVYDKYSNSYINLKYDDFTDFCSQFQIDSLNIDNRNEYHMLRFFHELFTGLGATNYLKGGMLEIPYFWHWITPNPRHEIINLPDSTSLVELNPPEEFAKYKTFADIDRTPWLFLSDLVSSNPKYYHPQCGAFATFGWCSEREMAFTIIMSFYGYEGKIKQSGIHTWSEFWIELTGVDGVKISLTTIVDNTFDIIKWNLLEPNIEKTDWMADIGQGEMIEWYNSIAHSEDERRRVQQIQISEATAFRIEELADMYLNGIIK